MPPDHLTRIRELTGRRDEARDQWRATIAAALRAGVPVADIADAAGITKARVYQIRDNR